MTYIKYFIQKDENRNVVWDNIFIIIVIALYYRQHSADIKMYNYKIKTRFVSPEMPKARANKTDFSFLLFMFIFLENWI